MNAGKLSASTVVTIRNELQRILSSETFEASERNRNFLAYVVEETLAGRSERIKAYSIATEVFGRGDDFDPLQDSIVRIEAGRLRRELEHFYLKEGQPEFISIIIPKGTYVPKFEGHDMNREAVARSAVEVPPGSLHELGPRVFVHKFEVDGELELFPRIGNKLTLQVISALTRYTEIFVYGYDTSDYLDSIPAKTGDSPDISSDYELFGTVTLSDNKIHVELLFRRTQDKRFVWAHDVTSSISEGTKPSKIVDICSDIAGQIVRKIADRDGILDCQAREAAGELPGTFAAYQKLMVFHEYWKSLDRSLFEPLRRDLEETILSDPQFAAAHASLSMLYSSAVRYVYDISEICSNPLERAMELARTAIRLAPQSSRAHHAKAIAEWFSGMPDEGLATLNVARSLNPNDSEILAELGFRYAMRKQFDKAVPLIEESYARNPMQAGAYHMGLFLYHFAEGRDEEALRECFLIQAPGVANVRITAAAALSRLGRPQEARAELNAADKIDPFLCRHLAEDLAMRQVHPDIIDAILEAIGRVDPRWSSPKKPQHAKIR